MEIVIVDSVIMVMCRFLLFMRGLDGLEVFFKMLVVER